MSDPAKNQFESMSTDVRTRADQVIEYLNLEGYRVRFDSAKKALCFKKAFKEMTIPLALVDRESWSDVRHIFRAVFLPGPQVENFGAANEWSREEFKK